MTDDDAKRDERMDEMEQALLAIQRWAGAYPVDVFPPLNSGDYDRARVALDAIGVSIDRLHAEWARHILDGIGGICARGLGRAKMTNAPEAS